MNAGRHWDAVADEVHFTVHADLEAFRRLVPLTTRVLDFGCGYGRVAARLSHLGYAHVLGYDNSTRMIDRGRRVYPDLQLHHLPALPVPEQQGSYGAALCCAVLSTVPDRTKRREVIQEIWRLLAPEAILYVVEFLRSSERAYAPDGTFMSSLGPPMKHFERAELLGEGGAFNTLDAWEADDLDLRGNPVKALHVLWQKDPRGE